MATFMDESKSKKRRESLARAIALVDEALAGLAPPTGPAEVTSPASAYRRRRSSIERLRKGTSKDLSAASNLVRTLVLRCAESADATATITAAEVADLRTSLSIAQAAHGRAAVAVSPESGEILGAQLVASPQQIANLRSWNFDVFEMDRALRGGLRGEPMAAAGWALLEDGGLANHFSLDPAKTAKFLSELQRSYVASVTYHNHLHGIDVAQTVHFFLTTGGLGAHCEPWERLSLVVAALAHDAGHWGLNNHWLNAVDDPLAVTYNYLSPLENMHASKALSLLVTPGCDLLANPSVPMREVRSLVVELILGTDAAHHAVHLAELRAAISSNRQETGGAPNPLHALSAEGGSAFFEGFPRGTEWLARDAASRRLVLKATLRSADVSNPCKPWAYYTEWADRIVQEFFHQGDLERAAGLPSAPGFDRGKVTCAADRARAQLGFINFVVGPQFEALGEVVRLGDSALRHLAENKAKWEKVVSAAGE